MFSTEAPVSVAVELVVASKIINSRRALLFLLSVACGDAFASQSCSRSEERTLSQTVF